MALFVSQDENRSELQQRLAAELQEKMKKQTNKTGAPDGVDDTEYIKGLKKTTSLAWVWILIVIFVLALIVRVIIISI